MPNAFTSNGNWLNDFLYPLNGWSAKDLRFMACDSYGQLVLKTTDCNLKWDRNISGNPAPSGSYVWLLEYTHAGSGTSIVERGNTILIR